jgi:tetratricopeptide (TPR) repeat protein
MKISVLALGLIISVSSATAAPTCGEPASAKTLQDWVRIGDCLREHGEAQSAVGAYRHGLQVTPEGSRDVFLGLTQAYVDLDRWEYSRDAVQAALHLDPADPETIYWLGITFEVAEDWDPALENFRKVIELRPNDNRAHRNIGFVLLQTKQPEAAIAPLEAAIAIAPNDWKAHLNLASAYTKTRQAIAAELGRISAEAGAHVVTPHEKELSNKLRTIDYLGKSLDHARQAAQLRPEDEIVWYGLGHALIHDAERYAEAVDALKHADAIKPGNYGTLSDLAYAQKMTRKPEEALATCRRLEGRGGRDKWLQVTMGDLNVELKHDEAAEKHYRSALVLDPQSWEVRVALARALRRMDREEEAQQEIATAKESHPELSQVIDHFGNR